jgi:hypothetical protein
MTPLLFNIYKLNISNFSQVDFGQQYRTSTGKLDQKKFGKYIDDCFLEDFGVIQNLLINSPDKEAVIKIVRFLLNNLDETIKKCRSFDCASLKKDREKYYEHMLLTLRYTLQGFGDVCANEYGYLCLVIFHIFQREAAKFKQTIEELLEVFEPPTSKVKIITTKRDRRITFEKILGQYDTHVAFEEYLTKRNPERALEQIMMGLDIHAEIIKIENPTSESNTTASNADILVTEQIPIAKEPDLVIMNVDDIIAIMCALRELKIVISSDGENKPPTNKQLAEIIFAKFKVKKKKGEGFFTLQTLEKYFKQVNDEASKYSRFEKRKKEILKALQSVR